MKPPRVRPSELAKIYIPETRSITSVDVISERQTNLMDADETLIGVVNEKGFNPYLRSIDTYKTALPVIDSLIEPVPDDADLTQEESVAYAAAILAGRVKGVAREDELMIEELCFSHYVEEVVKSCVGEQLETFDPGLITSPKYGAMVMQAGEAILREDKPLPLFGKPEGDEDVAELVIDLSNLSVLAMSSGSRLTFNTAINYLNRIEEKLLPNGSPARKEALVLEQLIEDSSKSEAGASSLTAYKEGLGEDWPEALGTYMAWGVTIANRNILKSFFDGRHFNEKKASAFQDVFRTRLEIYHELMLLEKRQDELEVTDSQQVEDLLDSAELFSQLDWTILPKEEHELEKAAREIVAEAQLRASKGAKVEISIERLNILKNIKRNWGNDGAYYARGRLRSHRKLSPDGEGNPDEYIILVLPELDSNGHVVTEHAIAESPIIKHNALYVLRGDVTTEVSWRKVYSLFKKDARSHGARAVKHTKGDGGPLVDVITNRVTYLLSCSPEEFSAIRFDRDNVRIARNLGTVAVPAQF